MIPVPARNSKRPSSSGREYWTSATDVGPPACDLVAIGGVKQPKFVNMSVSDAEVRTYETDGSTVRDEILSGVTWSPVAGVIIAAVFAASQSSVSSSLNSVATAWTKDFDARLIRPNASAQSVVDQDCADVVRDRLVAAVAANPLPPTVELPSLDRDHPPRSGATRSARQVLGLEQKQRP